MIVPRVQDLLHVQVTARRNTRIRCLPDVGSEIAVACEEILKVVSVKRLKHALIVRRIEEGVVLRQHTTKRLRSALPDPQRSTQ